MRSRIFADTDLMRETGPQLKAQASYRGTGVVRHTIPAGAAVGDYLVIAGFNGLSQYPSYLDGWATMWGNTSSGSSYWASARIHIKVCTQSDLDVGYLDFEASGYYFGSTFYVFSNPNRMFIYDDPLIAYNRLISFLYRSSNWETAASTSSVSSIVIPNEPTVYGPNYLKITSIDCNPNSSDANISYSGPGVKTNIEDGYWHRSGQSSYEYNSKGIGGTASGGTGGWSWIYIYLI